MISWSSGKDSAWMLYQLQQRDDVEILGLVTTLNKAAERVAMHAVRRALLREQSSAAGLPLLEVELPWPCDNASYESIMKQALNEARQTLGFTHMAFGDLFLEDIRNYRFRQMETLGLEPMFPIWGEDTAALAREMISCGLRADITCVDPRQLDRSFAGESFTSELLDRLPSSVDPCGENGEFHTFAWDGPMFSRPIAIRGGEIVERDGFVFADLMPAVGAPR